MLSLRYLNQQSIDILDEIEKSISGIAYEKEFVERMKQSRGVERRIFAIANSENNIKSLTNRIKELQKQLVSISARLGELSKSIEDYDFFA
jgi:peptidoglycan hydrolase CwlO-like protein